MKLSEAIREGAQKRPQCQGHYFQRNDEGVLCSCALGAAYEVCSGVALERPVGFAVGNQLIACLSTNLERRIPRPSLSNRELKDMDIMSLVAELNDDDWTREAIADYLERFGA